VERDPQAGLDAGEQWDLVQEQGQTRPLAEVGRGGAAADQLLGFGQELGGETRAVRRWRAGHGNVPVAATWGLSMNHPFTVANDDPQQPYS
jgi:hypothetical protein